MTIYHAPKGNVTSSQSGATNTLIGSVGQDNLTYTGSSANALFMYGGVGMDTLTNSDANVTNEFIYGGVFASKLYGGTVTGTEYIFGHAGSDVITGTGNMLAYGGASGNDSITDTNGNATLSGGTGRSVILVNDTTAGTTVHHHYLFGGAGAASLSVAGDNRTTATNVNFLYGGAGNDTLTGSASTSHSMDYFNPGVGTDSIVGSTSASATETLLYGWDSTAMSINLSSVTAGSQAALSATGTNINDHFSNISGVVGTAYADTITTGITGGHIWTGAGNDTINIGFTGLTNTGNETITGGAGNKDYVIYSGTEGNATGLGDSIVGGSGNDTLDFTNAAAATNYTAANLGISSSGYTQNNVTGVYANLSYATAVNGAANSVNFAGAAGEGTISGILTIKGTSALNDYLLGGSGATVIGGGGNETLVGGISGSTHDILQGNSANNIYDVSSSSMANWLQQGTTATGMDSIYGFSEVWGDKIYISQSHSVELGASGGGAAFSALSTTASTDNGTFSNSATGVRTLDVNAIVAGTVSATSSFAANSAGANKGDFVLDNVSTDANYGNLYWNPTGAANVNVGSAGLVEIAHIDMTSASATGAAPLSTLVAGDFVLVA